MLCVCYYALSISIIIICSLPSSSQLEPSDSAGMPLEKEEKTEVARPRLELSDSAEDPLLEEDAEKEKTEMEEGEITPAETVVTLLKRVGNITCITTELYL